MDLIRFDQKNASLRGHNDFALDGKYEAVVHGGCIIIKDDAASSLLHNVGYGHLLGERQERVNKNIFPPLNGAGEVSAAGAEWSEKASSRYRLELSFEEATFLAFETRCLVVRKGPQAIEGDELWKFIYSSASSNFIVRCAVYRHLRKGGWCVRSGLAYGCHYLLYQEGPDVFHASAAVRIENFTPHMDYVAANRALSNVKKAFITASVSVPADLVTDKYSCLDQVEVITTTSVTMFLDRRMNEETTELLNS